MDTRTRRILSMAGKVLRFEHEHPSDDPGHQAQVTRLEALLGQVNTLVTQENVGTALERGARTRRRRLRAAIRRKLRHLVNVATQVAAANPALDGRFIMPGQSAPNAAFLGGARTLLAQAAAAESVLVPAGLGAGFVAELTTAIAAFEAAGGESDEGRDDHVQARRVLLDIADSITDVIRILDGLEAARYADAAGELAGYQSARNIYGPVTRSSAPEAPTADGSKEAAA